MKVPQPQSGANESFNGTLGEEVLKREIFFTLREAKVLIEQLRREYNTIRPTVHWAIDRQPQTRSSPIMRSRIFRL